MFVYMEIIKWNTRSYRCKLERFRRRGWSNEEFFVSGIRVVESGETSIVEDPFDR